MPGQSESVLIDLLQDVAALQASVNLLLDIRTRNEKSLEDIKIELDAVKKDLSEIKEYANKWKGGFYAITAMGAFVGTAAAFWDRIKIWFH